MRSRLILAFIAAMQIVVLAWATDDPIPPCTTEEFVAIFELIAENQADAALDLQSLNDLLGYSRAQLELRDQVLSALPHCADGG